MKLTYLYGDTRTNGSPRGYLTDHGTAGVQGYVIDLESKASAEPPLPAGEDIVEIPIELIHKLSAALRERGL
jgi:hypothetical protein